MPQAIEGLTRLLMTTHAGMTGVAFERTVAERIGSARHPRFDRPYTAMVC